MPEPAEFDVQSIREVLIRRDDELRRDWQRSLPFGDAVDDRWERAKRLGFGEGSSIYDSSAVYGDVTVGVSTWIGPFTLLDGTGGGLTIGDWCSISAGVMIYTHDSVMRALSGGRLPVRHSPTSIGSYCYVGSQCVIAAGTRVGDQCVVAANSYLSGIFGDRTILGGSPARVIGTVEVSGTQIRLDYEG